MTKVSEPRRTLSVADAVETSAAQFTAATHIDLLATSTRSERDRLLLTSFIGVALATVASVGCEVSMGGVKLNFAPLALPLGLIVLVLYYLAAFGSLAWTDLRRFGATRNLNLVPVDATLDELREHFLNNNKELRRNHEMWKQKAELRRVAFQEHVTELKRIEQLKANDPYSPAVFEAGGKAHAKWDEIREELEGGLNLNNLLTRRLHEDNGRILEHQRALREIKLRQSTHYRLLAFMSVIVPSIAACFAVILLSSTAWRIASYAQNPASCVPQKTTTMH